MHSIQSELLAERDGQPAFITVAIPHYNRRAYAEKAIASVVIQSGSSYELLIADDGSNDDSASVLPSLLSASGVPFRYFRHPANQGYDRNVRFCLQEARGEYVLMLGNDDELASADTLSLIEAGLRRLGKPSVVVTNYEDWGSRAVTRRVYATAPLGWGPEVAARYFRIFSFTSGLIFRREEAAQHATDRWDTSIYYQIYLACRTIARGGELAGIDQVVIRDHIRLAGELVPETYLNKYRDASFTLARKHTGLDSVLRVTVAAVATNGNHSRLVRDVALQLYCTTYPYWLFEYRRLATWGHAIGIARDQWPARQLAGYEIGRSDRVLLWLTYLLVTLVGLIFPASVFNRMRRTLADVARKARSRRGKRTFAASHS